MIEIKFTGQTHGELIRQIQAYLQSPIAAAKPQESEAIPDTPLVPAPAAALVAQAPAIPAAPVPSTLASTAIPTAAPTYTREDLMTAGAQLMQKVGMPALQELMTRFGVKAVHELPEAQFGAFAQALREMGGAI